MRESEESDSDLPTATDPKIRSAHILALVAHYVQNLSFPPRVVSEIWIRIAGAFLCTIPGKDHMVDLSPPYSPDITVDALKTPRTEELPSHDTVAPLPSPFRDHWLVARRQTILGVKDFHDLMAVAARSRTYLEETDRIISMIDRAETEHQTILETENDTAEDVASCESMLKGAKGSSRRLDVTAVLTTIEPQLKERKRELDHVIRVKDHYHATKTAITTVKRVLENDRKYYQNEAERFSQDAEILRQAYESLLQSSLAQLSAENIRL